MSAPKVSVVMSVYNGERFLREAMESILNQTFTDLEFIIIDDGSTDGTWAILRSYADPRIWLVRNPENIGLTSSLNKGLRLARGEYIARQDADDVSLPERLANQMAYLQLHNNVGLLGTAYHVVDAQGLYVATHQQPLMDTEIRWQMLFHNAFCHTSVIFYRDLLAGQEPFYNEAIRYSQDYDLWARLLGRTRAANVQEPLVAFRAHESSTGAARYEEQQRTATTIAARQINTLIPQPQLTLPEVDTLRSWYYGFPQRLGQQDVALCRVLWQILNAFKNQPGVDRDVVHELRWCWIKRILAAMSAGQARDSWTSGLLGLMFRDGVPSALTHVTGRVISRIRHVLQGK